MPTGKHTSNTKAPAARPRPAEASRSARPAGASRSARPPQASRSARPPQGAHRGLAILAVVCVLALTAGFLLQSFLPAPVSAAVDERLSTSMVRISEVMTSNASAFQADNGQYTDWVELVNTGATDVSLKGYTLLNADDALAPLIFPDVTLAPGEYLLIYCDGTLKNAAGYALHAPFRLSASGVTLGLYDAEGARVDAVEVPGLERNFVYRRAQQDGAWGVSADYTPGLPNTLEDHLSLDVASADSPIVISEASSQNRTYARSADGEYYDYIELYNTSAQPVSLAGYTLTDDPNDLAKYVFPEGTSIPANSYCIV
ncbi:MAG TPA: lamin tail domain-containing protein, partial [Candidatus Pullichristensenella stercoripullorum]|nr:lamin tail domain-containing protein [Candidatus Pullichristensenella stercoripullorum]